MSEFLDNEGLEAPSVELNRNSILDSVKVMLNIEPDDSAFDTDIIFGINTAFAILQQLGVGPKEGFSVVDETQEWQDYIEGAMFSMVQQYVHLKVRLIFDPPANSFLVQNLESRLSELEWRLMITAEGEFEDNTITDKENEDSDES